MVWLSKGAKLLRYIYLFRQLKRMWRTDGRTDITRRHRPYLCIAEHGENLQDKITSGQTPTQWHECRSPSSRAVCVCWRRRTLELDLRRASFTQPAALLPADETTLQDDTKHTHQQLNQHPAQQTSPHALYPGRPLSRQCGIPWQFHKISRQFAALLPKSSVTYRVGQKKLHTELMAITLSILNRFSKFFHCWKAK